MDTVLIAFENAFRHLATGTSIEDALIETVGAGGDTDTNGAICGALLGAAQGRVVIPTRWGIAVLACRPLAEAGVGQPRPQRYWPDELVRSAEALLVRRQMRRGVHVGAERGDTAWYANGTCGGLEAPVSYSAFR